MPPRQRPPEAREADRGDSSRTGANSRTERPCPPNGSDADGLTAVAEAEAEAARAEARAQAARARALRLRRQAEAASGNQPDMPDNADAEGSEPAAETPARPQLQLHSTDPGSARLRANRITARLHAPGRKTVLVGVAMALICLALGASGYMAWQHQTAVHQRRLAAEFAAAARQGAVTLMSIDANHAKEDFQRIIDNSTGQLKDQLEVTSAYLVAGVTNSKISTKASVDAVAVESMTDNSAVVLVAAKSEITNPDKTKQPPPPWRLSLNITRDGGQLKMSKVEFVP
ncbi:hypothetical protein [Mycobacterium botniense]|uniref:Mce associated membrane protein n=1 Tax=Mycobacterium botniense TaxID=84962 RepID=A0A7I9XXX9_9MYCO|nr:hypothetical protein [Mycobacterium botniense]GFG74597.1 hypothetical protein MBOT_19620 [Mycobacterium botniense]